MQKASEASDLTLHEGHIRFVVTKKNLSSMLSFYASIRWCIPNMKS